MYTIYINTTKRFENKVILLKDNVMVDELSGDLDLTSAIKEILKRNNLNITELAEFDVNEGPGSFTGIKIGVTVVNVLNWLKFGFGNTKTHSPNYGSEPNIFDTPWIEK